MRLFPTSMDVFGERGCFSPLFSQNFLRKFTKNKEIKCNDERKKVKGRIYRQGFIGNKREKVAARERIKTLKREKKKKAGNLGISFWFDVGK